MEGTIKNLIKDAFKIDKNYRDMLEKYSRKDGIIAIIFYLVAMLLYYIMGVVYSERNLYLGYVVNILLTICCILIIVIRKQSINTIGFTSKNLFKSLALGFIPSAVLIFTNVVLGILGGHYFNSVPKLVLNFGYYLLIIALMEESIFRGFIQTRIYGIIQKPFFAVVTTAFMFMVFHIPFQMGATKEGLLIYVANNYITLMFTFLWHIVFNFMYSKYNSIAAPLVFHTFMNWSNMLFK